MMDSVTLHLNQTSEDNFCEWLSDYGQNNHLEKKPYPYLGGQTCYYKFLLEVAPEYRQIYIGADFSKAHVVAGLENECMIDFMECDHVLDVEWLKTGATLRVIIGRVPVWWTVSPIFDLLAKLGEDWPETRQSILIYIQDQAKKYPAEVEIKRLPWIVVTEEPAPAPVISEKEESEETEIDKYDELCKRWVLRPSTPYMDKTDFLREYADNLTTRTFDRILKAAYIRGVIDKAAGDHGRYKPKIKTGVKLAEKNT
jgi:hypothetical protein